MSLQTVLLIIGCIVIALIYVATRVAARKSLNKDKASFGEPVEDKESIKDTDGEALFDERQLQSQLDLKLSEDPQLGLFESTDDDFQHPPESEDLIEKDEESEAFPLDGPEILKIFLKPVAGEIFQGMDILRSLNHVGMTFGEMGIFHKIIESDRDVMQTLFSAANMFEPGSFNLQKIEAEHYKGLVFFMALPTIIDDGVALETLITTMERVAKLLGGAVYKTPDELIDDDFIDALRLKTNFIIEND